MKNETKPSMMTIKQIAKTGLMPENALRQLLKEGKLPVVYIGKKTKVPYCVRGYRADPGNKSTFSKFDQVISLANGYDGIGIGVFDDICAVDIDHCVEDGMLSEMANDIVKMKDF